MRSEPSLIVRLFGTEEPAVQPRLLRAGQLTAELEAGNLRHIRFNGIEVIRAVSFIVRDKDWGTYNPIISNLRIEETNETFEVAYDAVTGDDRQEFRYRATIEGTNSGLVFRGRGAAVTDFLTNRTGFVVLHPIDGVAGRWALIEHVDGRLVEGQFPDLIDPIQPMMNLRALTHVAAPGVKVTCRMVGDTFEMEDQRNWTDASYKTYVRPLALPWPYTLAAGTRVEQAVSLAISGSVPARASRDDAISLRLGGALGPAPAVGVGLDPDDVPATRSVVATLASVKLQHVICHYDPRRAHNRETLREMAAVAASIGARPWLEAVVVTVEDFAREIADLGKVASAVGSPFTTVLLSPASDLKCTLPGSVWPPAPPADEMFRAARKAFPGARIGGGMFSFFTEMNRKRPPIKQLDLVSFTTAAMVHAGDDHSVMEGLESLPAIVASARAMAGTLPLALGPSSIGLRMNPYGAAPMENPRNVRQAMNRNDPRQRGLLGAAWTIGYYARVARGGAQSVAFGGMTGPFGLLHTPHPWPQPWYDERSGGLFPVFHALRGLAALSGETMIALDISEPTTVQGICVETAGGREIWLANLTANRQRIRFPAAVAGLFVLDAANFVKAAETPSIIDRLTPPKDPFAHTLDAYAVARMRLA